MTFYHALEINDDLCIGCSRCMKTCPTEAIRIRDGKAFIQEHRCIDCGKCYESCPVNAIYVKQDDFESIHNYAHSVVLIPAVFMGQFPDDIRVSRVYAAIKELGFKHVCEIESAAMIYNDAKNMYIRDHAGGEPFISSFCPAIIRLIQIKYPSLVENVMHIKAPLDLSAMYALEMLKDQGVKREDIGVFYVTPCAAKIAAVKSPVGEERSVIDGVINMDSLYNLVYKKIKEQGKNYTCQPASSPRLSSDAILSTLTNGERRLSMAKRSYAIDGIDNVVDFLDKLENDEIEGVEFLELRACDQSCAGALLSYENRFLCSERMYNRARKTAERERNGELPKDREMERYKDHLLANSHLQPIQPRSMLSLDYDISKALEKMEKINRVKQALPQIDCGLCGAPTCDVFATDAVCEGTGLMGCVFFQRYFESQNKISHSEGIEAMNAVWGQNRVKDIDDIS